MSEDKKKDKPKKERAANYNDKLKVNGSFMDLVKVSVKDAEKKSASKK